MHIPGSIMSSGKTHWKLKDFMPVPWSDSGQPKMRSYMHG